VLWRPGPERREGGPMTAPAPDPGVIARWTTRRPPPAGTPCDECASPLVDTSCDGCGQLAGVPVGMLATFADDGWMAIEGRVRDAKSGAVVAMFADREAAKTRVVDVEAVTWYGQARESMNDWADQLVLLANTPKDVKVEDSSWFRLRPW